MPAPPCLGASPDETTSASAALFARIKAGDEAVVPAHWPAEILSALLRGKRRGRITDAAVIAILEDFDSLPIQVDRSVTLQELVELKHLSERMQLIAYDAIYLALAIRENLPLTTNDGALQ